MNWRGRGKPRPLPPEEALRRSIEDVVADIEPVASQFAEPPLFVSHSMGALATMKYVENHRHAGAALLAPGLPVETEEVLSEPLAVSSGNTARRLGRGLVAGGDERKVRHHSGRPAEYAKTPQGSRVPAITNVAT
ncbi:alpha/beta fold hydrolase [Streptomyces sp. ME18-1-4]|nr:alpha/beta fold hydrolase [Streptomyces sp. ME18-1-4]